MPYSKKNPPTFSKNMPAGAQQIAIDTANAVLDGGGKEEDAIRAAIANVKKEYKKSGDKWVPKAAFGEIEMVITKADIGQDGRPRWMATTSDTGKDKAGEQATLGLFQNWIDRVEKSVEVPFLPPPRVPFLGVSHYPSLDGFGEAGPTEKMYVDGNRFKACGVFFEGEDHPIAKALFEALAVEQASIKRGESIDEPMRISAAWWDLKHAHGDFIFTRKNLTDSCPLCERGQPRQFLEGQLHHWAVTRVPMNPRTDLALEEKSEMAKKTKEEDAASIIGSELAGELEKQSLVGKSDTESEQPALVVKTDEEKPVEKTESEVVEKSDEGMMERPFGGATDLESARKWIEMEDKLNTTMDYWQMFDMVMMNILEAGEGDKMEMMKKAISDFGAQVSAIKAGLSDASMVSLLTEPAQITKRSDAIMTDEIKTEAAQDDAYTKLRQDIEAVLANGELSRDQSNEAIQKSFAGFAGVVRGKLDTKYPQDINQLVSEAVAASVAPFNEKMDLVLAKLNQAPQPAQPVQKSIQHPEEQFGSFEVKRSSIRDIARKSVGLPQ